MVDHVESASQRLARDPNDPLERPARVQDRLDRPRNGNRTKEQLNATPNLWLCARITAAGIDLANSHAERTA
jgi:hypothetical protein